MPAAGWRLILVTKRAKLKQKVIEGILDIFIVFTVQRLSDYHIYMIPLHKMNFSKTASTPNFR
jgi:hypothetical protein